MAVTGVKVKVCEVLHRLQDEFDSDKLIVRGERNYFQTRDMAALLKMRGDIEAVTRVVQLGAIGSEVEPPDEGALYERRN